MSATRYLVYATVTPGLEAVARDELGLLLGERAWQASRGGWEARLAPEELWRLLRHARRVESVRVRIGGFDAPDFATLETRLARLPWAAYVPPGGAAEVHVECHGSVLFHTGAVAERVARAIARARGEPAAGSPVTKVHVRIARDRAQVSIDAAGELLHRRGYRSAVGRAPLRETLAAALVALAGLDPRRPLWDPFCGSGTLCIEAVAGARRLPAPVGRVLAFTRWPVHDAGAHQAWLAAEPPAGPLGAPCFGSDHDARVLEAARANAERAGVAPDVQWLAGDLSEIAPQIPKGAQILTNLPYGRRVRVDTELFARLGRLCVERSDLRPVVVLNGHPGFVRATGLSWRRLASFQNQGVPVEALALI